MVYAYCRKNNNHSVQSIEDWAENNSIVIDEFVWDDDAKQKDSIFITQNAERRYFNCI